MTNNLKNFETISVFYMDFLMALLDAQAEFKGSGNGYEILKADLFFKMAKERGIDFLVKP
jgi:hypothetical protein